MHSQCIVRVAVIVMTLLHYGAASAAPIVSIELSEPGYTSVIVDSTAGLAEYNNSYGTFSVNVTTGTGQPLEPASFGIDLNSIDSSNSGLGSLSLLVTETGLASAKAAESFVGGIGGTLKGSGVQSVVYSAYADRSNTAFGMQQQLGSSDTFTTTPFAGTVLGKAIGLTGLFSLTEKIVINTVAGASEVSFDGQLSPVPLPASAPLFGAGLLVLGAVGYGLKRKSKAAA